jgi:hypothetical protein
VGFDYYKLQMYLTATSITAEINESPAATLSIYQKNVGRGEVQVKAGDILAVKDYAFKVLTVVPREADRGIVGWVEIDPEPVTEAELKKATSIVRPKPLEK